MKLSAILRQKRAALVAERDALLDGIEARDFTPELEERANALNTEIASLDERIAAAEAVEAREATIAADREQVAPGAGEARAVVTREARTYNPDTDRSGNVFLRDVASFMVDPAAAGRIQRHMQEEVVERGAQVQARAGNTGNYAGLTVPQYLLDMVAPLARAARPFADAVNKHELPSQGMTVNISRITTGATAAVQSSENSAVSNQDIDDTLLTINVQTNAGQQTVSRQALERSSGVEDIVMADLLSAYNTTLDSTLINQATNGLTNVAGTITYTSASPTASELYPKLLGANAAVEAAILGVARPDLAVMHSRRWAWLQSQVGSTWPTIQQPGYDARSGGENYAAKYGSGARGVLPNGNIVIVDNNIATNTGTGTNQDEIYVLASQEAHLWEEAGAPVYIRAEQPAAASLGVLFVLYGYFAYTFARYSGATQKIAGTGLVTPTF